MVHTYTHTHTYTQECYSWIDEEGVVKTACQVLPLQQKHWSFIANITVNKMSLQVIKSHIREISCFRCYFVQVSKACHNKLLKTSFASNLAKKARIALLFFLKPNY